MPMVPERRTLQHRKAPRAVAGLEAMAAFDGRSLYCIADDISILGAKLRGVNVPRLPDRFTLTFLDRKVDPVEAEAVWRRPGRIGVRFLHGAAATAPAAAAVGEVKAAADPASPTRSA
jgi:hypothetical protein